MTAHAGTLVREARKTRGLRQWEIARDAGMSPARLSTIESGTDYIRPGDAARLGPVIGIAARDLLLAPRPARRPVRAPAWVAVVARSCRDIPASCACDWRMRITDRRPSGWELAKAEPKCRHHGVRT
jgi:transcriptional regulator with XRE-family HTH domain